MTGSPEPLVSVRHHLQTFLTLKNATYPIFEICFRVFFFGRREIPSKNVYVGETDHLYISNLFHFNLGKILLFHANFNGNDIHCVHFLFKI